MLPDTQPAPRLWSTQDLADYLGVAVQTIHAMRRRGEGPPTYRVGKVLRFDPDEVREWLRTEARESAGDIDQADAGDVVPFSSRGGEQRHA